MTAFDEFPNALLFAEEKFPNVVKLVLNLLAHWRGDRAQLQRGAGESLKDAVVKIAREAHSLSACSSFFKLERDCVIFKFKMQT